MPAVRIAAEQRQDHQNAKMDKKRVRAPKFEVGCKVKDNQWSSKLGRVNLSQRSEHQKQQAFAYLRFLGNTYKGNDTTHGNP